MLRRARRLAVIGAVCATAWAPRSGAAHANPQIVYGVLPDADFGAAVAVGDADADGYDDVLVGAPSYDAGRGYLALLRGGPGGLLVPLATAWELPGDHAGARLGQVVAALGDVNGDGHADFAAGEPGRDGARGRVRVYLGTDSGLLEARNWDGDSPGDRFGATLLGPGDVDGDGFSDVVVGSPDADAGAGRITFYCGATNLAPTPAWLQSGLTDEHLGATLARAWDVDGDGYADFLAGGHDLVALYVGAPDAQPTSDGPVAPFASGLGDTDGDGVDDLVDDLVDPVAAGLVVPPGPAGDMNGDGVPDAWVLTGALPEPLTKLIRPLRVVSGDDGEDLFSPPCEDCEAVDDILPTAVAAGDIDGDGYADLVYAVHTAHHLDQRVGAVYLSRGGPQRALHPLGPEWPAGPGPLGAAGDLDGDGFADVLVPGPDGALVVRRGGPDGPEDGEPLGLSGHAFAAADLDGDGRTDLAIASDDAIVVRGLVLNPDWRVVPAAGQPLQWIATGDVDGDGYVDLVTGLAADLGHPAVLAFRGDAYGLPLEPAWRYAGAALSASVTRLVTVGHPTHDLAVGVVGLDTLGRAALLGPLPGALDAPLTDAPGVLDVRPAGDVDGDGYDDVLLIRGAHAELRSGGPATLAPPVPLDSADVTGVGDLDRDGFDDLVALTPGGAHVLWGSASGPARDSSEGAIAAGATRVAPAGDVNGDGAADLLVARDGSVGLHTFVRPGHLAAALRARELDGTRVVASGVATRTRGAFAVDARPVGSVGAFASGTLELAVARPGEPFAVVTPEDAPPPNVDGRLVAAATDLDDGVAHRVRARIRAPLTRAPAQRTTPWIRALAGAPGGVVVTRPLAPPEAQPDLYECPQWGAVLETAPGLLANDHGLPGEALEVEIVSEPLHGDVRLLGGGGFLYEPRGGYWGTDAFRYRALGAGGSSEAEVRLTITPAGVCLGFTEPPCRAGRFTATLTRANDSHVTVRCGRDGDTLRCATDDDGALVLDAAPGCAPVER